MSATCSLVDGNVFQVRAVVLDSYSISASMFTVSATPLATLSYLWLYEFIFFCELKMMNRR